jgi:hypothetical protein
MRQRLSLLATLTVLGVLGWIVLGTERSQSAADPQPQPPIAAITSRGASNPAPTSRLRIRDGAALSPRQQQILTTYRAKVHAKSAAQLYRLALKSRTESATPSITSPENAVRALLAGLPGSGDIVYRLPSLNEPEIHKTAGFLTLEGEQLLTTSDATLSELEREIRRRENSCKFGACGDCLPGADPKTSPQFRAVTTLVPHNEAQ